MEQKDKCILIKENINISIPSTAYINGAQDKNSFSKKVIQFYPYGEKKYKSNDKSFEKKNSKKYFFNSYYIIFFIVLLIVPHSYASKIKLRQLNYDNYIIITIDNSGTTRIISSSASSSIWPNKIKINDEEEITSDITAEYTLTEDTNTIKMTWNSPLTSCYRMFKNVPYIQSIDLTHFDCSQVITMESFFEACSQVKSIDLSNCNAEKVENMNWMFKNDVELIDINFNNFKTGSITKMNSAFFHCIKLESLDLSSFNTIHVTNMAHLVAESSSLKSLDLSNFYTPSLTNMFDIFFGCNSLESLDISHFDTSQVTFMAHLFKGCKSLKYLDLRSFDTSKAVDICDMFWNCYSLTSVEIGSFDTTKVTNMGHMFYECRSLKSLNLSHFNTPVLKYLDNMFYNCHSLEYLDIISFNTENTYLYENMFFNTTSLISLNLSNFKVVDTTVVTNIAKNINPDVILCYNITQVTAAFIEELKDHEINCKKVCDLGPRIYIEEADKCVDNCYHSGTEYIYEYNRTCYTECPELTKFYADTELCEDCRDYYNYENTECIDEVPDGYYNNDTLAKTIDKCPNECQTCSLESVNNNLCKSCNNTGQYYYKSDDELNTDSFHKCYHKDEVQTDYYLDNDIFKPCYDKCKTCNEEGNDINHHCTKCNDENNYELNDDGNCICIHFYNYLKTECIDSVPNKYYNNDTLERTIDKCLINVEFVL